MRGLPPAVQELVRAHGLRISRCLSVESTDERTRKRRQHFGDYLLPVSVLVEHEGRFVLVHYASEPLPGGWTVPGGYSEPGETIQAAALREVREECGLVIELERPAGLVATEVTSPTEGSLDYYLTVFRGRSVGGTLEPEDRQEIDQVRLSAFEEIDALAAEGSFPSINPKLDKAIVDCLRLAARR